MPFFVVRFEHPDAAGWQQQLAAHIAWPRERVADHSVRASGPLVGAPDRAAMLIVAAPTAQAVGNDVCAATNPNAIGPAHPPA